MDAATIEELKKLAEDIYEQGYIAGFGTQSDKWLNVYAKAMLEIANGEVFGDELIFACDDDLPTNMNEVN